MDNSEESTSIELKTMNEYGARDVSPNSNGGAAGPKGNGGGEEDDIDNFQLVEPTETPESSEEGEEGKNGKKKAREVWDNKVQFILTLVGYAVGLGNIWRFSYLTAKNGGSAFMIPYLVMLFLLGIPLFYLELLLGQSLRKGPVLTWHKLLPNFTGVGIASVVVIVYICLYYNVIIAWVIFYFFKSFQSPLPWAKCDGFDVLKKDLSDVLVNYTGNVGELESCFNESTEYYWYTSAVGASTDIASAGVFNWKMFLCLMAAWVLIYIVYFTATFPYLILMCLFFRAVTLDGAGDGIRFLFLPDKGFQWAKLFSPQVWLEASTQIFFSLGVATGALIALSSYTKPHYNALTDSLIVCLINSATSIFSAIVVFSIIGFKAKQTNINLNEELVSDGPGLAFVVFTEAIIHMPLSPLWAVLFFIMLMLLGVDSQFATVEGLITVMRDIRFFKKLRKELLVAMICVVMFLLSFPFVLGNGVYLFQLWDQFSATFPLLLIGFFEFIAIGWVIGVKNFFNNVTTRRVTPRMMIFWTVMWKYVTPLVMIVIFFGAMISELVNPLQYVSYSDGNETRVDYPSWAQFVGCVIVLTSVLCMPVYLIARLILFESGREEALVFIRQQVKDGEELLASLKRLPHRTLSFLRSLRLKSQSWSRHSDEGSEDIDGQEDLSVPYSRANGTPVLGSYGTQITQETSN
ncbi:Sodium- and chloride-dependent glycine transporter 2 [Geodia barretti]|uniref:Sodium- and chloride-dependent glycine transporter 2 n=1 Tax=Geodia barretti TaxID=519541 RepID=A0AA35RGH8_GEOBA|nr:Sodium- and chloride-dependent glycine transporter 2 [Geodia barretti]